MRILAGVKQPDDALRVDHDVPAHLPEVFALFTGNAAAENVSHITSDAVGAGQGPPIAFVHRILLIKFKIRIQQQRPIQIKFAAVRASHFRAIKCYDFDIGMRGQFRFELTQLRKMTTARRSAEMPVEQQHQPTAAAVLKSVNVALVVGQLKRNSGLTNHVLAFRFKNG